MIRMKDKIDGFLLEQKKCLEGIIKQEKLISEIINVLIDARDSGKKIFIIGNGGSASTASHFASDLTKTAITKGEKRFMAFSLVDNVPVTSAWANDVSFEDVFVEQLKNFLSKNDVVIAFSGSGSSPNVIKALEYTKQNGAFCIGFTGMSGGHFPKICNICLNVPSNDMLTIESAHVLLFHCIVSTIRNLGIPLFKYE